MGRGVRQIRSAAKQSGHGDRKSATLNRGSGTTKSSSQQQASAFNCNGDDMKLSCLQFSRPHLVQNLDDMLSGIERLHAPIGQAQVQFELMLFLYLFIHTILQNFNIYHSNYYNYNFYLFFLTLIILLKRVLLVYWTQVRWQLPLRLSSPHIYLNLVIITLIVSNSLYLLFQLFLKHPFKNFLFLAYPFMTYVACYGLTWKGVKRRDVKKSLRSSGRETTEWFVDRLKGVAYSSLECGYFAGFLPLKFLQHDCLYFDSVRCAIIILYITLNSFVMLFAHLLCTSFHELYLHSQMLGYWRVCKPPPNTAVSSFTESEETPEENGHFKPQTCESKGKPTEDGSLGIRAWSEEYAPYKQGTVVRYRGKYYVAVTAFSSAEPGLYLPWLIYMLFGRPERAHAILILVQSLVVLSQLCLLLNATSAWGTYAIMLGCSYGVLYYCITTRRTNLTLTSGGPPSEWLSRPLSSQSKTK